MNSLRLALAAGIGLLGLAGATGIAAAQEPATHVMTVPLPGGGIARITYTGDVAPRVAFEPAPIPWTSAFGPYSPFAELERISAEMNREAAALFQQIDSGQLAAGPGYCMQSVQITSLGDGSPPKVVTHTSGNCGPSGGTSGTVGLPAARPPAQQPDRLMVDARGARPYAGLVRSATWNR
jgi:hypothetical protein